MNPWILITTALGLAGRFIGLKPGKPFKALRGPMHLYPVTSLQKDHFGVHTCMRCGRFDQDETPYTDPPCARSMDLS